MFKEITDSELILEADGSKRLPHLEDEITDLDLFGCSLETLVVSQLPAQVKKLNLYNLQRLSLLTELPDSLEELSVNSCKSIKTLPDSMPEKMRCLTLIYCISLKSLPKSLPNGITYLVLAHSKSLKSLTELPADLEHLDLEGCESLESLPESLPNKIKHLNLLKCKKLKFTPELIERLLAAEK